MTPVPTTPATPRLRALLQPGAGLVIPGAANALAARLVQAAGFPVVYLSGAGVANTHLGAPDMGLVSVSEMVAHVAAVREAVQIPLVADGDTGFGNALNLMRTVRLYERAGANAIQLEDQVFPKRCGHFEGKSVVPAAEMVGKIHAALDARHSADFLVMARTDARATEGLDAALERMRLYQQAGADLLFIEAPLSRDELARIPRELPGPHIANVVHGGKTPMLAREDFAALGFAGILYANAAMQAAMQAMQQTLATLHRDGSLQAVQGELMSFADRQAAVDQAGWVALERRYAQPGG